MRREWGEREGRGERTGGVKKYRKKTCHWRSTRSWKAESIKSRFQLDIIDNMVTVATPNRYTNSFCTNLRSRNNNSRHFHQSRNLRALQTDNVCQLWSNEFNVNELQQQQTLIQLQKRKQVIRMEPLVCYAYIRSELTPIKFCLSPGNFLSVQKKHSQAYITGDRRREVTDTFVHIYMPEAMQFGLNGSVLPSYFLVLRRTKK